jgi:hypothetical protein
METNLRPLTLGEILDRTAQLYRTNFVLFAGISAILAGVILALRLVTLGITQALHLSILALSQSWAYQAVTWSSFIVLLVIGQVATAANNRAVAWVYLGEPASITSAYRSIIAQMRRYLWIGTAKLAIAWSPVIVLYAVFQAFYIHFQHSGVLPRPGEIPPPGTPPGSGTIAFMLVSAGFFLLIWPALIYSVFMALRYALAIPASVVEGLTTRETLRRSTALSKGTRGRILVLWLLVGVIWFIAIGVTQSFFVAYSMRHHFTIPWWLQIVQQLIAFGTNTFVGPILAIGTCLFYYDQRVRREGYDIEWMMQAAGMAPGAASAAEDAATASADGTAPGRQAAPPAEELVERPADVGSEPAIDTQAGAVHE